jgi:uncharacterized protein YndB with AHSA1/START domain
MVIGMAEDTEETGGDEGAESNGSGNGGGGALRSALTSKELLIPAALSAASAVAATKGPDLIRSLTHSTEEKGEEEAEKLGEKGAEGAKRAMSSGKAGFAGKVASKALGGGGGGGSKKTRRLPIQRWTDVAVPVEQAYEAWTEFDKFPRFMHRVLEVKPKGDDKVGWQEKIWFSTRQWEGKITDRRKNDRIAWKTTSGMSHSGVVSFHPIAERLTRVMVTMEFEPNGMIEKMASGLRFVKRAVQADLARFKAYVELEDAKGVEYRPVTEDDEESGRNDRSGRQGGDDDDGERDADRRERESRRQERREATTS